MVSIHAPREGCDRDNTSHLDIIDKRFNSRTPGGVRPLLTAADDEGREVSIHAPREGCDGNRLAQLPDFVKFQFTHPGRGATTNHHTTPQITKCFNSRTPGGVRLSNRIDIITDTRFQFTHPGRGATCKCDRRVWGEPSFNSRTPGGVRLG